MGKSEMPVFFDGSGQRWKRAKIITACLLVIITVSSAALTTKMLRSVDINRIESTVYGSRPDMKETRSAADLAYSLDRDNLPIFGSGPLLRVVAITHDWAVKTAIDPYSGKAVSKLTPEQIRTVGDAPYAVQKYGETKNRKIALTFDDGPDSVYTPLILDILAKEKAPSTFFATGTEIAKNTDIAQRISREGHVLANHTFAHADLDHVSSSRAEQEITQAQRIIRSVSGRNPAYFRIPYGGNDDVSIRDDVRAILEAQKLGYTVVSFQVDSNDWDSNSGTIKPDEITYDGTDIVVLLHDGGGERKLTVQYLPQLIEEAKKNGYTFTSLDGLYEDQADLNPVIASTIADKSTLTVARAVYVWPKNLVRSLFMITVLLLFITMMINVLLAGLQIKKPKPKRRSRLYNPLLTVIIPAYNEEKVLSKSVRSVLKSYYRNFEIIIVNDGSSDTTKQVAQKLARNPKVIVINQENSGKSVAVNTGIRASKGEIIISMDADTIFPPKVLGKFVRHFADPSVGAVAGMIKVGNINNIVSRWQALEYITSINVERSAQAYINAILIAPGACSAWRKNAVIEAGGYSGSTLAEDCDLTLSVRKAGYRVIQDNEAEAYTEAPLTLKSLAKQRFRWVFGNIQTFWKHRDMIFRRQYRWLGLFVIPRTLVSISLQLLFTPLLLVVTLSNLLAGEFKMILFYFSLSNIILLVAAIIGIIFAGERYRHLVATPFYRLAYGPMRTFLLYASIVTALKGLHVGWSKLARTGTVSETLD
jgi:cellulose synthase/poly-beta-1,6-N-acetylglucosamine synthase-like glycosyltransferase/peptidoglycan/xylan/chitin deacetylase (PgdA/CDA1 family)